MTYLATAWAGESFNELLKRLFPAPITSGNPNGWWVVLGAMCTIAMISYVFRDNVLFRIGEHLLVGVSMGYGICVTYFQYGEPNFVVPFFQEGKWTLIFPAAMGIVMIFRIIPRIAWLSRYPLGILVGMGMGEYLARGLQAVVFYQIAGPTQIDFAGYLSQGNFAGYMAALGGVVTVVGTVCALMYFYFSMEHRGMAGGAAKIGIIILMIGFGASFGYTVQARITLLADRMLFLFRDWLGLIM